MRPWLDIAKVLRDSLSTRVSQRGIEANPEKVQAIVNMASPKTVKEV